MIYLNLDEIMVRSFFLWSLPLTGSVIRSDLVITLSSIS